MTIDTQKPAALSAEQARFSAGITPLTECNADQIRDMLTNKHPLAELALELGLRRAARGGTLTPAQDVAQRLAIEKMRQNGHAR